MADTNHIYNITVVGASGQVGSTIFKHLLNSPKDFKITVVTRTDSTATFPSNPKVTVKKVSYLDAPFIQDASNIQDVVIFALHFMAQGAQIGMSTRGKGGCEVDRSARVRGRWLEKGDGRGCASVRAQAAGSRTYRRAEQDAWGTEAGAHGFRGGFR
ncbi:hypothetical protein LTR12_014807 [Friedmanniomyces endolithicus]|nr:hypothetical protein LTR12_014807 [Friedmanniomyces endolithicus]